MNSIRSLVAAGVLAMSGLLGACASSSTGPAPGTGVDEGKAISGIDITPSQDTMDKDKPLQLHATARYADGTSKDVTSSVVWNTSAPSVATISKDGTVTAHSVGLVNITADYKGVRGNEHFVVKP